VVTDNVSSVTVTTEIKGHIMLCDLHLRQQN